MGLEKLVEVAMARISSLYAAYMLPDMDISLYLLDNQSLPIYPGRSSTLYHVGLSDEGARVDE